MITETPSEWFAKMLDGNRYFMTRQRETTQET